MSYLLDTDIASAYLRGNRNVFNRFVQHGGNLHLSILSLSELYSWVYATADAIKREAGLLALLSDVALVPLTEDVARRFGQARASLQRNGTTVPTVDLLIACTALEHGFTVVTHNRRHFSLVPGLPLDDWITTA